MNSELVLSLSKMSDIEEVDDAGGQLVVQAGTTLGDVQRAASAIGWKYGIDLSARDSASIGGTIATNAGGTQVLRYGNTRQQILGLEAVTGSGKIIGDLRGLTKDNTGYHLPSLLCGSEGTLAVVTRARLRLVVSPEEEISLLLGFQSLPEALNAVQVAKKNLHDLQSCEMFFHDGLMLVCQQFNISPPWTSKCHVYLIVEVAGQSGLLNRIAQSPFSQFLDNSDYVGFGQDGLSRQRIWQYRELHTEAISAIGIPHKLDITIPHNRLSDFCTQVGDIVTSTDSGARVYMFGHAGDGNIHVNIVGPDPENLSVDEVVLRFVASLGGSISAEHGIGRAKVDYLHLSRTADEIALFRKIKEAFDPTGILNPGVIID